MQTNFGGVGSSRNHNYLPFFYRLAGRIPKPYPKTLLSIIWKTHLQSLFSSNYTILREIVHRRTNKTRRIDGQALQLSPQLLRIFGSCQPTIEALKMR